MACNGFKPLLDARSQVIISRGLTVSKVKAKPLMNLNASLMNVYEPLSAIFRSRSFSNC